MYLLIYIDSRRNLFTSTVDELSAAGVAQVTPVVIPETDIYGEDILSEGSKTHEQTVISNNL